MDKIRIASNPVVSKILDITDDLKLEISELLSYQVAGAEHSMSFKNGSWTGRSTLFSYEKAVYPTGLTPLVISFLKKKGYEVSLIRSPAPVPLGITMPEIDDFGYTEEYAYQYKTVDQLVKYRSMIARVATGGGKSRIGCLAFARIKRPTLFITTRSVLMYQMKEAFEKTIAYRKAAGEKDLEDVFCGTLGDSEWRLSKHLNVAMVQTIQARLKNPETADKMRKILEHFEFVILEEAHESSGEGYYQVMNACKNAHYRLSLTGTPFMREDEEANMRLMAVSGAIGIRVSELELIEKGILATPEFKILKSMPDPKVKKSSNWQLAYKYGITHNAKRNEAIVAEAMSAVQHGLSVMILVQRREHGKTLYDMLEKKAKVKYIFGDSDRATRKKALEDLRSGDIQILIGSTILDVGVDVPAVGMVINAGAGKAEVALRQRIGRGLRRKAPGTVNKVYVVDFEDKINKHLVTHSEQRRQILLSTPGFAENILDPDKDFSFKSDRIALASKSD